MAPIDQKLKGRVPPKVVYTEEKQVLGSVPKEVQRPVHSARPRTVIVIARYDGADGGEEPTSTSSGVTAQPAAEWLPPEPPTTWLLPKGQHERLIDVMVRELETQVDYTTGAAAWMSGVADNLPPS